MKKIKLFSWILVILLTFFLVKCTSKKEEKKYIVGIVNLSPTLNPFLNGFKEGLAQKGFIEGKNLEYIYHGPSLKISTIKENVKKLISARVDLIYTLSGPATKIAKNMTKGKDIPVVFTPVYDPVAIGITESLQKQTNSITGVQVSGYIPKSFNWLQRIVPDIKKIAVPYNPKNKNSLKCLETLKDAVKGKNVELVLFELFSQKDVISKSPPNDIDAVFIFSDILVISNIKHFITMSLNKKIPLISTSYSQAKLGALATYGSEWIDIGKQAARQAGLVLKGANPSDLPIESPDFYFSINLKTAKAIGISISDEILEQADNIVR